MPHFMFIRFWSLVFLSPFLSQLLIPKLILSVKWGEKFLKLPHTPPLPAASLWLSPTYVAFWVDVFVCQRWGAFQRFQRTECFTFIWSSALRIERYHGFKLKKQKESQPDGWKRCLNLKRSGWRIRAELWKTDDGKQVKVKRERRR